MRGRRAVIAIVLLCIVALGWDLTRPPASQLSTRALLASIDLYQGTVSRVLSKAGARCRFTPSCSHYGEAVIRKHGALVGGWLALKRIARCGPWTPMGTEDPPP